MPIPASIFSRPTQAAASADLVKKARYERASIYSGGFLMDVVDTLSAPLYAIGGVIQGEGALKGVKKRRLASEAFGMKSKGVGGFTKSLAVDILFDPLTYLSFGTSSVLKSGGAKIAGKNLSRTGVKRLAEVEAGILATKNTANYVKLKTVLKDLGVSTLEELTPKVRTSVLKKSGVSQAERSAIRNKAVDQVLTEIDSPAHEFLEKAGIWVDIPFVNASKKVVELPSIFRAGGRAVAGAAKKVLSPIIPYARIKNIPDSVLNYGNKIRLVRAVKDMNMEIAAGKSGAIEIAANLEKKFGKEVIDAVPDVIEEVFRDVAKFQKKGIALPKLSLDDAVGRAISDGIITGSAKQKLLDAVPEIQRIINASKDTKIRLGLLDNLVTDIGYVPRTKAEKSFLRGIMTGTTGKKFRPSSVKHRKFGRAVGENGETLVGTYSKAGREFVSLDGKKKLNFVSKAQVTKKIKKIESLAARKVKKIETGIRAMVRRVEKVEEMINTLRGGKAKAAKDGKKLTFEQVKKAREATLKRQRVFLKEIQFVADEDVIAGAEKKAGKKMPELTKEQKEVVDKLNKEIDKARKAAKGVSGEGFDAKNIQRIKDLIRQKLNIAKKAEKRTEMIKKIKTEAAGKVSAVKKKYGEGDVFRTKEGKVFTILNATKRELKEAGVDVLEDRFAIPLAKDIAETAQARATGRFAKKLSDDIIKDADPATSFGMLDAKNISEDGIQEGYVNLEKLLDNKLFRGVQVPEEVGDALKGYMKINTEEESRKMLKAFDTVQGWWKNFALVAFAYHSRNAVTNVINNWLGGLNNPQRYIDAGMLQFGRAGKLTKESAEMLRQAKKYGVVNTGFYGSELAQNITDALSKPGLNPLSLSKKNLLFGTQGGVARGSRAFGTALEDNARLAMFMDRIAKGDTFSDAAIHTKKFLFDYGELTPFERSTLKRLIPFYTWTRKNIPLQVEMLIKEPRKGLSILKTENAAENAVYTPEEQEDIISALPEWMRDGHPIILPFKDKDGQPVVISGEGFLPIYDLSRIGLKKSFHELVSMLSPIIKTPLLELPANKSLFTGGKLDYTEPENAFLYDKIFDGAFGGFFGEEYTRSKFLYRGIMNETQAQMIKQFYRPLREVDNLFELGKTSEEKNKFVTRMSAFLIAKARPIDIFAGKGYNEYLDSKAKEELMTQYKRSYKNYLRYENELDKTNMDILQRKIQDTFEIEEGEIEEANISAFRTFIKYDTFEDLVRESVKTGNPIPRDERSKLVKQLADSYKDKSIKRALAAFLRIEEEIREKLK